MIAENFNDFITKILKAERTALNKPVGQEITQKLLEIKLEQNPNMTPEEWQQTKIDFMTFLFAMFIKENPNTMKELGSHVWNELRKTD